MSKTSGRALIAAIVVLIGSNWFYARRAKARPQITYGQPACKSSPTPPASWGEFVGKFQGLRDRVQG